MPEMSAEKMQEARALFDQHVGKPEGEIGPETVDSTKVEESLPSGDKAPEPSKPSEPTKQKEAPTEAKQVERSDEDQQKIDRRTKEYRKAKDNLILRAGYTAGELNNLEAADVIARWERMAERESEMDRLRTERAELQKKLNPTGQAAGETQSSDSEVPRAEPDLDVVRKALAEQFGEDAADSLQGLISPLQREIQTLKSALDKERSENERQIQDQVERLKEANRERLGERFLQLQESDRVWNKVHELASELVRENPRGFSTPEEAYDAAVREFYGLSPDEALTRRAEEAEAANSQKEASVPDTSTHPSKTTASPDQVNRMIFDKIHKEGARGKEAKAYADKVRSTYAVNGSG